MSKQPEHNILKEFISLFVESQSEYRLDKEVLNVIFRLSMDEDAHVPDTLTRIRALPTVTVVGQKSKVLRPRVAKGKSYIDIYIKFLPIGGSLQKNLKLLGEKVKSLPGVISLKVLTVNDRNFLIDGKPMVM
tara:strand:+ start:104 stop:499 length:396 start_codon:yes stop_codon:yes gene_type:complete